MDCARNIITANFSGGGTSATTAPLWQWDYGQALCITGIDLPAAFEVHFSTNRTGGVSTVAVGADGQVTIPNDLLTIGKNLNAWIYLSDAQGEGETEYSITIPVKARPMPETYDAEVSGEFDDVVRQVSEYAETAQTAADNAGASASAAAASASEAAASASAAETAKNAAETAQGKAEDAQAAAETAAQTATEKAQQTAQDAAQAAHSKADAESAAGRAEAAQTGAESAKTDAETAAQGAADSASAASASATSAGQAASAAAQSATAAAQSAASIEGDVQTASQKAAEATVAAGQAVAAKDAAQTAQQGAEAAETNAGQSASTATTKAAEAAQSATDAAASETAAEAAATRAETAAASLTVDSALSDTSVNPVQNKVITGEVTQLKSALNDLDKGELYKGIVKGRYVNNNTKVLSNYSAWDGSAFINISGMDSIVVTNSGNQSTVWNGFFATTADTTAISTFTVRANETAVIEVPDGANYVILSHYTAQYPYLSIQSRIDHELENLNAEVDAQTIKNTAFTHEIDLAIKNSVSDNAFYFNPLDFELGNISSSGFEPYSRRVASQKIFQNDMVTHIKSVGDYKFYINLLNDDGTYKNTSGWKNDYTVPSGQKFMMMFSPYGSDVSHILDVNLIPEYIMNLSYSFETEYEYSGERLIPEKQGYAIKQLSITPTDAMVNNSQGLAVYEHTLFQIVGDVDGTGEIVLVNLDTNAIIKSYDVSVGHGGNAFFLDEFYDQSDSYPLFCVCTNEYPNVIRVFRLTASTAVKVREYQMQEADGYWAQVTYDNQTGMLYSIGYSANSFMDATGNKTVIATYDILTATETSANVFAPTLVSRYAIPFIYCTQGLKYYAGKLIVISSFDYNVQDSRLYIIQPASRQILGIIKDFPIMIAQWEVEGIDIVDDEWVLIGTRPRYFKMTLY